jgi:hypothetical protein
VGQKGVIVRSASLEGDRVHLDAVPNRAPVPSVESAIKAVEGAVSHLSD